MEKTNTLTTRKIGKTLTVLFLVMALLSGLFALTVGKAADNTKPKHDGVEYDNVVTFDANGGTFGK
ncbi:MAG: hypothetical protein IJ720_03050, partial [Clostridia bacterium]|nr:hypothetical protein [Clostridia bacterium]